MQTHEILLRVIIKSDFGMQSNIEFLQDSILSEVQALQDNGCQDEIVSIQAYEGETTDETS